MELGFAFPPVLGFAIGIILLADGIYQIIRGKYFMADGKYDEYTPESVAKTARITGVFFALMGVVVIVQELQERGYFYLFSTPVIYYVIIAALLVCAAVAAGTLMKRK